MARALSSGYDDGSNTDAKRVVLDTDNFTGALSSADDNVQKAFETLDQADVLSTAEGDARYLKLDQTTPQYIENGSPVGLAEPSFTYASGQLTRIDYPSGYYKEFSYNVDGTLASVDYNGEHTKSFTYSSGVLQSIGVA